MGWDGGHDRRGFACAWASAGVLLCFGTYPSRGSHTLRAHVRPPCKRRDIFLSSTARRNTQARPLLTTLFPSPFLPLSLPTQIRINFNITMLDVPCEFATVDILDVLGTNQQNVTKNIEKWNLDQNAQRRMFQG